jgi:pimeloyl-ACP methyl ester carboxylesterase
VNAARILFARRPREYSNAIEAALRTRVARPSDRALSRSERVVFDAGSGGAWTVHFKKGGVSLERGRDADPSATLSADAETLLGVLDGSVAGVEAFLRGDLSVRGNLALPLELDDLLHPVGRDPRSPSCHRVFAHDVESFYLEAGPKDGKPVVLIHGLGATSASFLPTLWDLARDHRVYAVDLPGFGESGKPVRPLHAPYFARWLVALLDALQIERAHLIGNSMGGRVSLEVALRWPERVEKLALYAPSLAWKRYRVATRLVRLLRPEIAVLPVPVLHRIALGVLRSMFAKPDRVPAAGMAGAADEFIRVFGTPRGRIAFFHAAREIYLEDPHGDRGFWDRLPSLSRPALFIFGTHDWLVPHGFMRYVKDALPQARCELFDDCGHVPQFELPDRTHALTREFFGG